MILSAAINLSNIQTNTSGELLGIYASGIVGGITILTIPIFSWIILKKSDNDDFAQKYGTLTDELSPRSKVSLLWNIFMLTKWLITTVVLMTLSDYPSIQVMILFLLSLAY